MRCPSRSADGSLIQSLVNVRVPQHCSLCGKEGFRCDFVTTTRIFLMQASGLEGFGLMRFEEGKRFFPDASFGCTGRQRRRGCQARDDEPEKQEYYFSRSQAAAM